MLVEFDTLIEQLGHLLTDPAYVECYNELQQKKRDIELLKVLPVTQGSEEDQNIQKQLQAIEKHINEIPQQFDFVNRINEKALITNIYCSPYLIITAPSGYGKTRLLRTVKAQLAEQKWLCIHLALSRERVYTIQEITQNILQQLSMGRPVNLDKFLPEQCGRLVGRGVLNALQSSFKDVIFILDEAESLQKEVTTHWLTLLLSVRAIINNANPPIHLRMIVAGRYLTHWKQFNSFPKFEFLSLTPFDFPSVHETVDNFATKNALNMQPSYNQNFAAHLMYLTGGYPLGLVGILRQDYCLEIQLVAEKQVAYYRQFVRPVVLNIQRKISVNSRKIFKNLSIFRMYNTKLLQKIIDAEFVPYNDNATDLENDLATTYLVHRKNGFIQDDIVRRLFAIQLRMKVGNKKFAQLCQQAQNLYEEYLRETSYYTHSVALEALYQELQYKYYDGDQTLEARKALLNAFFNKDGILQKYLNMLVRKEEKYDILKNLQDVLQKGKDWEFRFTLNFFMRRDEHYTDEPYQRLLQEIDRFMNSFQ